MRNPSWTKDELILALDLYFREPSARGSKSHPEVIKLSNLLNNLPVHQEWTPGETFRNPNGVGMKLSNFLKYDPEYSGIGLQRGSKLEQEVWDQYADNQKQLRKVAKAIADNFPALDPVAPTEDDYDEEASEGKVLTRVHKSRERNSKIVQRKKKRILDEAGSLVCEACGFDFVKKYGELGYGFAECHHSKPVSELEPGEKTRISDLRVVCANCHRMIHRAKPWLSVDQLKRLVESK